MQHASRGAVLLLVLACSACPGPGGGGGKDGGAPLPSPPAAPTGLKAVGAAGGITLSWSPVHGATSYHLYFAAVAGVTPDTGGAVHDVTSPYLHPGCGAGVTCYYVVTAGNAGGESAPSAEVNAAVPAPGVPATPTGVSLTAGDGEVTVGWDPVTGATGYLVYWSPVSGASPSTANVVATDAPPLSQTGLANGTTYYYRVAALGPGGESAASAEVSATPQAGAPGAPVRLQAVAGAGQVWLYWSPVPGAASYRVYFATAPGVTPSTGTGIDVAPPPSYAHLGLTDGTTYYYVVTAIGASGEGPPSPEVSATPELPAPQGLTATPADTGEELDLAWNPLGLYGITGYDLYWSTTPGVTPATGTKVPIAVGDPATFHHQNLTDGVTYYYVVTALSGAEESAPSAEASGIPRAVGPTGLAATPGDTSVTLTWSPKTGATSYDLYWSTTSGVSPSTGTQIGGVSPGYTQTGLTNGTTYYYVVTAVGAAGDESLPSPERSAIPYISAPTGVTATAGDGQVTVAWSPVPGATSYDLYWDYDFADSTFGTLVANVSSPWVHTGLTNGTTYAYVVVAHDAATTSDDSAMVSAIPHPPGPPPPANVVATPGPAQVTLTWDPVAAATAYDLYFSTSPGVTPATGTRIPGVTSPYVHTGLTAGTTYYYVITAETNGVEGNPSAEVSATAQGVSLVAPTGVTATARYRTAVLTWSPVAGATGYNVYYGTATGVTPATGTAVTGLPDAIFIHAPLTVGTTYYYVVTATNAGAEGPPSAEVSLTGQAVPQLVSMGSDFALAAKSDGTAWSWGGNSKGQLGDGTTTSRGTPAQVGTLAGIVQVSAGVQHGMVLDGTGQAFAWGRNQFGELGDGSTAQQLSPVPVLASAGTPMTGIAWIAAGGICGYLVKTDGSVWSWGTGNTGRLGAGPSVTARYYPGQVLAGATPLTGVWKVVAGGSHGVALANDGTVWTWGYNSTGQLGDGTTTTRDNAAQVMLTGGAPLTGVVDIAAGSNYTLALTRDGRVWGWGDGSAGELGNGGTAGALNPVQATVASGQPFGGVVGISADSVSVALQADGSVWDWGYNLFGTLGDGTSNDATNPVQVVTASGTPLAGVSQVETGGWSTIAFGAAAGYQAWGSNGVGQLGAATTATCTATACSPNAQPVTAF